MAPPRVGALGLPPPLSVRMDGWPRSSRQGNRVEPRHLGGTSPSGAVSNAECVSSSHHQFVPESIVGVQLIPLTNLPCPWGITRRRGQVQNPTVTGRPRSTTRDSSAIWTRVTPSILRLFGARSPLATGAEPAPGVDERQGRGLFATGAQPAELFEFRDRTLSWSDSSTATASPCSVKVHGAKHRQSQSSSTATLPLRRDADGASEISHGGELRRRRLLDARSQKHEPAGSPEPRRTEFELFDLHRELGPGRLLGQLLSREELGIPQRRRTPHLEGSRRSTSRRGPTSPSSPCTGSSSRFRSRGGQLTTGTSRVQGRQLATGARRAAGVRVPGADAQRVDGRFATATLCSDEVQGAHRAMPGHVGTCRAEPLEKASARGGKTRQSNEVVEGV